MSAATSPPRHAMERSSAIKFVVLIGIVSLFADMTYEGARSINGPYLAVLGASATVVGIVAGFGELVGYGLRLGSGYLADRTGQYWTLTFTGYLINLGAVPLLALAGRWEIAAALMIAERVGKAIRTPARDAMLSHATQQTGRGWGFGLHEAMDQIGAVSGPLVVAAVLYARASYPTGFAVLLVPAILALVTLTAARMRFPRPRDLEIELPRLESRGLQRPFWIYLVAAMLVGAGYVDFSLVAFHFQKASVVSAGAIPVFYAVAMGIDALAALVFGRLFDRKGLSVLVAAVVLAAFFPSLVFFGGWWAALLGMALWGIGMGSQESIMRAAIANMAPPDRRGQAYGLFNAGFGIFWFLGSALMGVLYDVSISLLVAFSVATQLAAIPFLLSVSGRTRGS